jgi:hypothetical protein
MRLPSCGFVLALLSFSLPAFAQGNDLYGAMGGRATLMGNTGVALARDGAAPLYNPATIVRIKDQRLAFSAHFFSFNIQSFSDWHQPGTLDSDQFGGRLRDTSLSRATFHLPPSTVCLFITLEDLEKLTTLNDEDRSPTQDEVRQKLAFCFASLESEDVDLQAIQFSGMTRAGPTTQVQSLERQWNRTYIGPTYGMNVNDDLALGGSIQVVYAHTSFGVNGTTLSDTLDGGGAATTLTTSGRGRTFGIVGLVGMTYHIQRFTLGVSARTPVFQIAGSYDGAYERSVMGTALDEDALVESGSGSLHTAPPIRIAVGGGLSLHRLTLELDFALNLPMQNAMNADLDVSRSHLTAGGVERSRSSQHFGVRSHATLNPSAGAEYKLNPGLSLFTGISANFSSLGKLHPTESIGNLVQARTNHINAAFGVGSYWSDGELLFGVQFDYGWGEAIAIDAYALPNHLTVVDASAFTAMFVLSGAANLRSIVSTVNKIAGSEDEKKD